MDFKINIVANTKQAGKEFASFYNSARKVNNSLSNISKDANRMSDGFKGMTKAFSGFNQVLGVSKVYMLGTEIAGAVKASLDMIETVNLFNVSLGNMAEESNKALTNLSDLYGLDITNLQSSVGTYALLARSMGMTSEQASQLSLNTSKLALDLASLTNVPINQVMADLKSGLVGQSETVYKYGIDITEAGIAQEAMNQGIEKSVRDMSQGEKMALRYATMIRQTGLAQGDFARTLSSPANQLKVLHEQLITLARSLGSIFIPMLTAVLPYLNAFVSILIDCANAVAEFFGFQAPQVANTDIGSQVGAVAEGAGDASDGLDDATKSAKKFKSALVGIDEINLLPQPDAGDGADKKKKKSGAGGGDSILKDIKLPSIKDWMSNVKAVSDELKAKMLPVLQTIMKIIGAISLAFTAWKITELIMKVMAVGGAFTKIFEIITMIKKIGLVPTIAGFFPEVAIFASVLTVLSGIVLTAKGLYGVLKTTKPELSKFLELMTGIALIAGGVALFNPLVGGIILATGAVVTLGLALYKTFAKSVPYVEVLGEGISDATKKKLKPFLESVNKLKTTLLGLELNGTIISNEDIANVKSQVSKITKAITDELDADKNESLKKLAPLKNTMSKEAFNNLIKNANSYYDNAKKLVTNNEKQINDIMLKAKKEGRALTKDELDKINALTASSNDVGIKNMTSSAKEYKLVMQRLKDDSVKLSIDQSSEILKQAKKSHDDQIAEADKLYDEQVLLAETFYGENGKDNKKAYDDMIKNAKTNRDNTIKVTDEQWEKVKSSTSKKLGENAKWIDINTGTVKSRWKVFTEDMSGKFNTFLDDSKKKLKEKFPTLASDLDIFKGNMKTGWDNFTKGLKDGWAGLWDKNISETKNNKKPMDDEMKIFKDNMTLGWNNFTKGLKDSWSGFWSSSKGKTRSEKDPMESEVKSVKDNLKTKFGTFVTEMKSKWSDFWKSSRDTSRNQKDPMASNAETGWSGIKGKFKTFKTNFSTWWYGFWGGLSINLNHAWGALSKNLAPYLNPVIGQCESFVNWMIGGINKAILSWNHIKSAMGISGWTYPIDKVHFNYLARGGSLDTGAYFRAGENGKAETIGSYQGKTTVMPLENTDFVQAMYNAVYDAVTSAMDKGSAGESGDLVLKVGETEFGRVAINSINNATRRDGRLGIKI